MPATARCSAVRDDSQERRRLAGMVTLLLAEPQRDRPALEPVRIDHGVRFPNAADGEYHDVGSRSRAEYAEVPAPGLVERDMRQVREHGARVAGAVVFQAVGV